MESIKVSLVELEMYQTIKQKLELRIKNIIDTLVDTLVDNKTFFNLYTKNVYITDIDIINDNINIEAYDKYDDYIIYINIPTHLIESTNVEEDVRTYTNTLRAKEQIKLENEMKILKENTLKQHEVAKEYRKKQYEILKQEFEYIK